ncbi:MAG: hypothetical protein KKD39_01600 [Candidatus Altiarchaeota archaeon]|nr:hypothetical protein [Candidatus Altiarchaeota archaeon]
MKKKTPIYQGFRVLGLLIVSYLFLWLLSAKTTCRLLDPWATYALSILLVSICLFFVLLFDVLIFPWDYSVFGEKRRHKTPHGGLIYAEKNTFGGIGWLVQIFGLITFKVYEEGLLIELEGAAGTFIDKHEMTEFETYKLFKKYRKKNPTHAIGGRIYHTCPEIRSPITVSQKVYDEVKKVVKPHKEREFF